MMEEKLRIILKDGLKIIDKDSIKYVNSGEDDLEIFLKNGSVERYPFDKIKYVSIGNDRNKKERKKIRELLDKHRIRVQILGIDSEPIKIREAKKKWKENKPKKKFYIAESIDHPNQPMRIENIERKTKRKIEAKTISRYKISPNVIKSENPKDIIEKPISTKLIIHGMPGTGKTFVVINRIKYLIKEYHLNPEQEILILSFSRNAVREIKTRVVNDSNLKIQSLNILTFDKFAARLLIRSSISENPMFKTYDQNIRKASELLQNEELKESNQITHTLSNFSSISKIKHLFIDEVQDLEDVRAQFSSDIISYLKKQHEIDDFGFTLLGDMNQEIFSFLRKKVFEGEISSSTEFLNWIKKQFQIEEFELTHQISSNPRFISLPEDKKNRIIKINELVSKEKQFDKIELDLFSKKLTKKDLELIKDTKQNYAFLTRTRYSAAKLSDLLFALRIKHFSYLHGVGIYPEWLGALLLKIKLVESENQKFIEKTNLLKTIKENPFLSNIVPPGNIWANLENIAYGQNNDVGLISIHDLKKNLENNYDETLLTEMGNQNSNIIISDIHKVKGREFDNVNLLKYKLQKRMDLKEEFRIYYVALTRGKYDFSTFTIGKLKNNCPNYRKKKTGILFIKMDEERKLNKFSFLKKKKSGCKERQNYILENIQIGDQLKVKITMQKEKIVGLIYHNGKRVGKFNSWVVDKIYQWLEQKNLPINQVFYDWVAVKTTEVVSYDEKDDIKLDLIPPPYRTHQVWSGFETLGFLRRKCDQKEVK